jgi:hypothetical protein
LCNSETIHQRNCGGGKFITVNAIAIGLGVLAVLVAVYIRLSIFVFKMTYETTQAAELQFVESLRINRDENMAMVEELRETIASLPKKDPLRKGFRKSKANLEMHIKELEFRIRHSHWKLHHFRYSFTRGVWVYIVSKITNYFK